MRVEEELKGSLTGKLADLVVLSHAILKFSDVGATMPK